MSEAMVELSEQASLSRETVRRRLAETALKPWRKDMWCSPKVDAGKKIKGRKRHILTDTLGLLLRADVHSAGIQDRDGAARLFGKLTARFPFLEVIIGDGGYAGAKIRTAAPRPVEIVKRSDQAKGFKVLPKRWIVERTLAWISVNLRLARDFERDAETAAA